MRTPGPPPRTPHASLLQGAPSGTWRRCWVYKYPLSLLLKAHSTGSPKSISFEDCVWGRARLSLAGRGWGLTVRDPAEQGGSGGWWAASSLGRCLINSSTPLISHENAHFSRRPGQRAGRFTTLTFGPCAGRRVPGVASAGHARGCRSERGCLSPASPSPSPVSPVESTGFVERPWGVACSLNTPNTKSLSTQDYLGNKTSSVWPQREGAVKASGGQPISIQATAQQTARPLPEPQTIQRPVSSVTFSTRSGEMT